MASGSNPFYLVGDSTSITYIKNIGTTVSHFLAFIQTSTGQYTIGLETAQPGETVAIDIGQLRDSQVADAHGNKLPKDIMIGQINWRRHDGGAIVGRTLVLSQSAGISSNRSCQPCQCAPTSVAVAIDPPTINVGDTALASTSETDTGCDGSVSFNSTGSNLQPSSFSWESLDPSVATIDESSGQITGVSPGQATIILNAGVSTFDWRDGGFDECGDDTGSCTFDGQFVQGQGTVTVKPTITSITPAQGAVGDTVPVTIAGRGLAGATVNAGSGITATVTSSSDTQVQANFVISASASGGNRNVTVTANGQPGDNSKTFFVQIPTSLSVVPDSVSVLPSGSNSSVDGCLSSTADFGINISITYQINDQNTHPISTQQSSIYRPKEIVIVSNFPSQSGTLSGDLGGSRLGTPLFANTSGQFIDAPFGACVGAAFSNGSLAQTINLLVGGTTTLTVRSDSINAFIVNGGPSSGHGSVTNNHDISASR